MEETMKLTYKQRNGHDRTKFSHANSNAQAKARRERAILRFEDQLKRGVKTANVKDEETGSILIKEIELTEKDRVRIRRDIDNTKKKV
jgi:methionine-rich copper-binding protein CopC